MAGDGVDRQTRRQRAAVVVGDRVAGIDVGHIVAAFQRLGHGSRVVDRFLQLGYVRIVVIADDKRDARVNLIRDLLSRLPYKGKKEQSLIPDPSVVFEFERAAIDDELLAP